MSADAIFLNRYMTLCDAATHDVGMTRVRESCSTDRLCFKFNLITAQISCMFNVSSFLKKKYNLPNPLGPAPHALCGPVLVCSPVAGDRCRPLIMANASLLCESPVFCNPFTSQPSSLCRPCGLRCAVVFGREKVSTITSTIYELQYYILEV